MLWIAWQPVGAEWNRNFESLVCQRLEVVAFIAERLLVVVAIVATVHQRNDVVYDRSQPAAVLTYTAVPTHDPYSVSYRSTATFSLNDGHSSNTPMTRYWWAIDLGLRAAIHRVGNARQVPARRMDRNRHPSNRQVCEMV